MKRAELTAWWNGLAGRERRAIGLAGLVLLAFLLWQVGMAPAWRTLRDAPAQKTQASAQLQRMKAQAAWVKQMQAAPARTLNRASTLRALEAATQATLAGHARTEALPDQVRVTLDGVTPEALANWLQQVRLNAALLPREAELNRSGQDALWNGTVVLAGEGLLKP